MSHTGSNRKEYLRLWRIANPEKVKASNRKQYLKNSKANIAAARKRQLDNPEQKRKNDKRYNERHRTNLNEKSRERRNKNKERYATTRNEWVVNNKTRARVERLR
jgi:hypothetical protein